MTSEKDFEDLENRRQLAMLSGDLVALDELLDDDLVYTHASALQDTKSSFIESLRSGDLRYIQMARSRERVRVFMGGAVVTGIVDMRALVKGNERSLRNRYINVWIDRMGQWRMLAWQSTALP